MALKKEISEAAIYSSERYLAWQHREARQSGEDVRDLGMLAAKAAEIVDPTGRKAIRASMSSENSEK